MKRCPTCNQTFSEGWLSFCTQDGTTLVEDSVQRDEPPPTMMSSAPPPPFANPNQPGNWSAPSGGFGSGPYAPPQPLTPQPIQSGWQPPPAPTIAGPKQSMAIAALCCGLFSMTFGWCCSLGLLSSPVAIVLGIVSLLQIKNNPDQNTGKPLAIIGIVAGAAYLAFWVLIFFVWGLSSLLQGLK